MSIELFIRKHQWVRTSDNWGERCLHCNNFVGINTGTEGITLCNERFNTEAFLNFLDFKNYSLVDKYIHSKFPNKFPRKYIKRFSNTEVSEEVLIEEFKTLILNT